MRPASSRIPRIAPTAMLAMAPADRPLLLPWRDDEEVDCAADAASCGPAVNELPPVVPEVEDTFEAPCPVNAALDPVAIELAMIADRPAAARFCVVVALLPVGVRDCVEGETAPQKVSKMCISGYHRKGLT